MSPVFCYFSLFLTDTLYFLMDFTRWWFVSFLFVFFEDVQLKWGEGCKTENSVKYIKI